MKKTLKTLYRRDKKLAIEVAKVLGYKIITADEKEKAIKSIVDKRKVLVDHLKYIARDVKKAEEKQAVKIAKELSKMVSMTTDILMSLK